MGESFGLFRIGNDEEVMKYITSCNIACGGHGGDPLTMQHTIEFALQNGVKIGAHPAFYDLQGFGRREMFLTAAELSALIKYQVSALKGMTEATGGKLHHVKPHGALYNMASRDESMAATVVQAILSIDKTLVLYGPPESAMAKCAAKENLPYANEVFADRNYHDDLSLVSRQERDALITDKQEMFEHINRMLSSGKVKTVTGNLKNITADTVCIHGDQPEAAEVARKLRTNLEQAGYEVG